MENVKILAIVGMSGSGKSVAVDYLTEKGYPKVYFGGMILGEMERRGIEITEENEKQFREMIRETEGSNWVVEQAIREVHSLVEAGQRRIVLDGVYSWTEYKILRHEFPGCMTFVGIVVDKKLRYQRVGERAVRPLSETEIKGRDVAEIENLEKGGPIVAADYYVLNNGTVPEMTERIDAILKEIKF
ncbi:AAA family ATPase [Candidatus Saccharibacteria bacterium]|nr:AAA family ATPase [Candidatus Saccharibacteria bacterium]